MYNDIFRFFAKTTRRLRYDDPEFWTAKGIPMFCRGGSHPSSLPTSELDLSRKAHVYLLSIDEPIIPGSGFIFARKVNEVPSLVYALGLADPDGIEQVVMLASVNDDDYADNLTEMNRLAEAELIYDGYGSKTSPMLPKEYFSKSENFYPLASHPNDPGHSIYVGPHDICDPESIQAMYNVSAIYGGHRLRHALPGANGNTDENDLKRMFRSLSLGKIEMMDLYPPSETPRFKNALPKLRWMKENSLVFGGGGADPSVLPEPGSDFEKHIKELHRNGEIAEDLVKIWNSALGGTIVRISDYDEFTSPVNVLDELDAEKNTLIGEAVGVDIMIDAYMNGISLNDILA